MLEKYEEAIVENFLESKLVGSRHKDLKALEEHLSTITEEEVTLHEKEPINEDMDYECGCGIKMIKREWWLTIYYIFTRNGMVYVTEIVVEAN